MEYTHPPILVYVLVFLSHSVAIDISSQAYVNRFQHSTWCTSTQTYTLDECRCFDKTPPAIHAKLLDQEKGRSKRNKVAINLEHTIQRRSTPMVIRRHDFTKDRLE